MSHVLRKTGGAVLILAGLVLMPIPILPGIPFVFAGLALVGVDHPLFRKWSDWLQKRVKLR